MGRSDIDERTCSSEAFSPAESRPEPCFGRCLAPAQPAGLIAALVIGDRHGSNLPSYPLIYKEPSPALRAPSPIASQRERGKVGEARCLAWFSPDSPASHGEGKSAANHLPISASE